MTLRLQRLKTVQSNSGIRIAQMILLIYKLKSFKTRNGLIIFVFYNITAGSEGKKFKKTTE